MDCPKCGKQMSKKIETIEKDGGVIIRIECKKCVSVFEAFVNPIELEEVFDDIEQFVS